MFVRSFTLREIADFLNGRESVTYQITFQQVHYDVKKILQEWADERAELITNHIEKEIQKLDKIEAECWEAWEKSKSGKLKTKIEDSVINQTGDIVGGKITERSIETSNGNPKYLDMIQECIDKRLKLLGLYKPLRIEADLTDGRRASDLTEEELDDEIARIEQLISAGLN
jgi:hypothetical protein